MLRTFLIYLSKAGWAQKMITGWGFARRAASRFVAGETVSDAIRVVRELNAKGINATLDQLGEHTSTAEEANASADAIVKVLQEIDKAGVKANVSIKLTQIGMGLDEETCRQNLVKILEQAKKSNNFIRIDMEDSPTVDTTLGIYRQLRHEAHLDNVGVVIQAYLYRSEADIQQLIEEGARVRLCKGAYAEPADVAFPHKADVDANYLNLARLLLSDHAAERGVRPAFATHDAAIIEDIKAYTRSRNIPASAFEFQMLHGIRRDLQEELVNEGYQVRIYVPYGTAWYPYFVRRLAERPANLWFFISNYFRA